MQRFKEIIVSTIFMVILVLPFADSVFNFIPEGENIENRALKTKPEFNCAFIHKFPDEFDKYYIDNFNLRNQFLWFNSKLKFEMFNIPPVDGKAFIGRNGWMYLVKNEMDIYLGNNLADTNKLKRYYNIFNYRKNFLDSIDCKYYVVIAPIKTSVYPEYLPLSKRKTGQKTLTDQLVNLLDTVTGLTLIDLRSIFVDAKGGERMYHKTHNHWNDYGAYIAYNAIMNIVSNDFPSLIPSNITKYKIETVKVDGMGLTRMMGIYDGVYENKIILKRLFSKKSKKGKKRNYTVIRGFRYTSEYEMVFATANDSLPKMLMNRDSFGTELIPFLSEYFSESVYIFDGWCHRLNEDIVLNEKPDIYIQLVHESFIPNIYKHAKNP